MKKYMTAAVLAALVVVPAFAHSSGSRTGAKMMRSGHEAFGVVAPLGSPTEVHMTPSREAAIRECNAAAAKTYHVRDSNCPISMYRACMAQHAEPE
jgi:hypothetical protein